MLHFLSGDLLQKIKPGTREPVAGDYCYTFLIALAGFVLFNLFLLHADGFYTVFLIPSVILVLAEACRKTLFSIRFIGLLLLTCAWVMLLAFTVLLYLVGSGRMY